MTTSSSKGLRVTLLCLEWPGAGHSGGVARYAYRMASELADQVTLTVVTQEGGVALPGAHMCYVPATRGRLARYYLAPIRLRRAVRESRPGIVHAFGDDWAVPVKGSRRVRHYLGLSISEARTSSGLRKINHYLLAALEKYSQRRAHYRIGISPESAEAFRCQMTMPPLGRVAARLPRVPTAVPSLIFIGSFHGRKRGYLAQQAQDAARDQLGVEVNLVVVGPPVDAQCWPAGVTHVGNADDAEVQTLIANSWALIAPSAYEGFGIPVFEALNQGVRAITSSTPGSEYIASVLGRPSALQIVADDSFVQAVVDALTNGPSLTAAEQAATREGVDRLIDSASVTAMIDKAYRDERYLRD